MSKIVQIVKAIAKDNKHPTYRERYYIYYDNGDSVTCDTHQLTEKMCKYIAAHKFKAGDEIKVKETGLIYKEFYA